MLLDLTRKELCFIDDSVTLIREHVDIAEIKERTVQRVLAPMASTAASINFITKIGTALLESVENEKAGKIAIAPVDLDEEDLLLIREVAHTGAVYDEERVGLNLKVKVHEGLRRIAIENVVGDLPVIIVDEVKFDKAKFDAYQLLEDDE